MEHVCLWVCVCGFTKMCLCENLCISACLISSWQPLSWLGMRHIQHIITYRAAEMCTNSPHMKCLKQSVPIKPFSVRSRYCGCAAECRGISYRYMGSSNQSFVKRIRQHACHEVSPPCATPWLHLPSSHSRTHRKPKHTQIDLRAAL